MNRLFVLLFLLLHVAVLPAQIKIHGVISQKTGAPLSDVVCTAMNMQGTKIYGYGFSDEQGRYSIDHYAQEDSIYITYKLLGFKTEGLRLKNVSQTRNVRLTEADVKLKEVVVKSPKIAQRGDTITYSVTALKHEGDDRIIDVIRRLPGVEVSQTGTIRYMGKSISKFYIEGMDMLDGRYSIATNSIPTDMVQNIQVLENHQPKKVLQGKMSTDKAALNIRLKKEAKLRPIGNVSAGAGYGSSELKVFADIMALLVRGESQTMITAKGNNTGGLLKEETTDRSEKLLSSLPEESTEALSVFRPTLGSTPQAIESYVSQNRSGLFTFNRLVKLKSDNQLKLNAYWLEENDVQESREDAVYGISGNNPHLITRIHDMNQHEEKGNIQMDFTRNSSSAYLDNKLSAEGYWHTNAVQLNGTNSLRERYRMPYVKAENLLDYTWSAGKQFYSFKSKTGFQNLPQHAVFENTIDSLLEQGHDHQRFYTYNEFGHTLGWGQHKLGMNYVLGAELERQALEMSGSSQSMASAAGNGEWRREFYDLNIIPSYSYSTQGENRVAFSFSVPTMLYRQRLSGSVPEAFTDTYLHFSPKASFRFSSSRLLSLSLSGGHETSPVSAKDYHNLYYYTNSTILYMGAKDVERRFRNHATLSVEYRNPYLELFSRLMVMYNHQHSNLIKGYDFQETRLFYTQLAHSNSTDHWMANLNISKLFSFWRTNLNVVLGMNRFDSDYYQQGVIARRNVISSNAMVHVDMLPVSWLGVSLNMMSMASCLENQSTLWMHRAQASLQFKAGKRFTLLSDMDFSRNQIVSGKYKNFLQANVSARISLSKSFLLDLILDNLSDQRLYQVNSMDGINMFNNQYVLRPRSFLAKLMFNL